MQTRPVYGLVLAGGESRRMGQDKALLQHHGRSQLSWLAELLEKTTDNVFVSMRSAQQDETERSRYSRIVDRYEDIGPMAGILSALETHAGVDWLIVACDLPNIDAATLRYLLDHRSEQQPFTAYRSNHDGLPEPLCAVYRSGSDALLREFVAQGIICPRKAMLRSDTLLLNLPDAHALDNINTPADLERSVLESHS